jgi:hypothetical protein
MRALLGRVGALDVLPAAEVRFTIIRLRPSGPLQAKIQCRQQ